MSYRILTCSDFHGDKSTGGLDRFEDVEKAAWRTANDALLHKVDLYAFLGDLCDPDSGSTVVRNIGLSIDIALFLAKHNIRSVWIAGNHDVIEDGGGLTTLHPLSLVAEHNPLIVVCQLPQIFPLVPDELSIVAMPFTASSHPYHPADYLKEILDNRAENPRSPAIVVASHLHLEGIHPGSEATDMPRGREIFFPFHVVEQAKVKPRLMLNGHIHKQQVYRNVHIPGSLVRLTFGEEAHTPGYLVIDI
jgi:DNA repair exonuclease SbcCD nuclease subunit